jgi:hypothetical protein
MLLSDTFLATHICYDLNTNTNNVNETGRVLFRRTISPNRVTVPRTGWPTVSCVHNVFSHSCPRIGLIICRVVPSIDIDLIHSHKLSISYDHYNINNKHEYYMADERSLGKCIDMITTVGSRHFFSSSSSDFTNFSYVSASMSLSSSFVLDTSIFSSQPESDNK